MITSKKIILILLFIYSFPSNSVEIRPLVKINDNVITNVDLFKEIKFLELLSKKKVEENLKKQVLENLIDEKIKDNETHELNIVVDTNEVKKRVNANLNNYTNDLKNSKEIYKYIQNKIEISMKWNNLITSLYSRKLEINTNEIKEKVKSSNNPDINEDYLVKLEKQKKINILSKTHFNLVKKKYYIKYSK